MKTPRIPRTNYSSLCGRDALVSILAANGVRYVFGNPGTTEQGLLRALSEHTEITYILSLQESVSLSMADGYARAAGAPAVVNLHATPGLGNAMGQLFNSYRHGTPLIVTAGQSDTRLSQQEPTLGSDLVEVARPMVKWAAEARTVDDIPMLLRRAFKDVMHPPRKPVFISLPTDVMDMEGLVEVAATPRMNIGSLPASETLDEATDLLISADRPAIICGEGVGKGQAVTEMVRLAEASGAAVFTMRPTEVAFPTDHPQYAGQAPRVSVDPNPLSPFDVILLVGMAVFPHIFPPSRPLLPDGAAIIHVDADPWEVGRNEPIRLGVVGDIKLTLAELSNRILQRADNNFRDNVARRTEALTERRRAAALALNQRIDAAKGQTPMASLEAFAVLRDELPDGALVFDDSVSNSPALNDVIGHTEPGTRFLTTHRGGGIGWALGAAIGGQLARPDRRSVAVSGDGAAMYAIQALWTAAHYKQPVVFIIVNNLSYELLKIKMREYLADPDKQDGFVAMDLANPAIDFAGLARAQGVEGAAAETGDEFRRVLREAFRRDGPSLIDARISP